MVTKQSKIPPEDTKHFFYQNAKGKWVLKNEFDEGPIINGKQTYISSGRRKTAVKQRATTEPAKVDIHRNTTKTQIKKTPQRKIKKQRTEGQTQRQLGDWIDVDEQEEPQSAQSQPPPSAQSKPDEDMTGVVMDDPIPIEDFPIEGTPEKHFDPTTDILTPPQQTKRERSPSPPYPESSPEYIEQTPEATPAKPTAMFQQNIALQEELRNKDIEMERLLKHNEALEAVAKKEPIKQELSDEEIDKIKKQIEKSVREQYEQKYASHVESFEKSKFDQLQKEANEAVGEEKIRIQNVYNKMLQEAIDEAKGETRAELQKRQIEDMNKYKIERDEELRIKQEEISKLTDELKEHQIFAQSEIKRAIDFAESERLTRLSMGSDLEEFNKIKQFLEEQLEHKERIIEASLARETPSKVINQLEREKKELEDQLKAFMMHHEKTLMDVSNQSRYEASQARASIDVQKYELEQERKKVIKDYRDELDRQIEKHNKQLEDMKKREADMRRHFEEELSRQHGQRVADEISREQQEAQTKIDKVVQELTEEHVVFVNQAQIDFDKRIAEIENEYAKRNDNLRKEYDEIIKNGNDRMHRLIESHNNLEQQRNQDEARIVELQQKLRNAVDPSLKRMLEERIDMVTRNLNHVASVADERHHEIERLKHQMEFMTPRRQPQQPPPKRPVGKQTSGNNAGLEPLAPENDNETVGSITPEEPFPFHLDDRVRHNLATGPRASTVSRPSPKPSPKPAPKQALSIDRRLSYDEEEPEEQEPEREEIELDYDEEYEANDYFGVYLQGQSKELERNESILKDNAVNKKHLTTGKNHGKLPYEFQPIQLKTHLARFVIPSVRAGKTRIGASRPKINVNPLKKFRNV